MRLRRQHAWGAILIALFALPVWKPEGIGAIERPVADVVLWSHRHAGWNLSAIGTSDVDTERPTSRERALLAELETRSEGFLQYKRTMQDKVSLQEALEGAGLDRLPLALSARVLMAHDPVRSRRSITIDRGADDGIQVGHTVVLGRIYLGRVREVRDRASIVQLVTDRSSRAEVLVRTTKQQLLRGFTRRAGREDGGDRLDVGFVQEREGVGRVIVGAPVFTANFDPRVPANLLVGHVSHVSDPDLDRMPTLRVRPALDVRPLTSVIVLLTDPAEVTPKKARPALSSQRRRRSP